MNVRQDIRVANQILEPKMTTKGNSFLIPKDIKKQDQFSSYSKIYPYTNDELSDIEPQIKRPRSVLSVGGSFDHPLMCLKNGATKIQTFDISRFSYYNGLLKLGSIEAFSYLEFVEIYNDFIMSILDIQDFIDRISPYLPKDVLKFWNGLDKNNLSFNGSMLFNCMYSFEKSPLCNEHDYNIIKQNIKKCKFLPFINTNIYEGTDLFTDIYDVILLSNITSYYNYNSMSILDKTIQSLISKLSDDGIIQIGHIVKEQKDCFGNIILPHPGRLKMFSNIFDFLKNQYKDSCFKVETDKSTTIYYKKS